MESHFPWFGVEVLQITLRELIHTEISSFCFPGALNSHKVQGKIVLCDSSNDGTGVLIANGVGSIIVDSFINDFAFSYSLPATVISREDGLKILNYIKSTEYINFYIKSVLK